MSSSRLPERASLEYLRKVAKEKLRETRGADPRARLSDAQLAIAREYGFPSWRALKAEVDRRRATVVERFFAACTTGGVDTLRELLAHDVDLVRERDPRGTTGLHLAVSHPAAVRLLLEHGADPATRDRGDHALPLHFAAGGGHLDSVRALLDAGSDVHGHGDLHQLDVIGWATVFERPHREVVELLVSRGARNHVFSAIALGDPDLVRRVVRDDPRALGRRLSRFEQEQTALHYVIAPPDGLVGGTFRTGDHYRTLEALLELGAELEATDSKGRTPLAVAMLRGDGEAMRLLQGAGARAPVPSVEAGETGGHLQGAVLGLTPMLAVPDMEAAIAWYRAVGFTLVGHHCEEGALDWAALRLGAADVMLVPSSDTRREATGLSLWLRTDRIDDLYAHLRHRQVEHSRATLQGNPAGEPEMPFVSDLHTAFYGQREFSIRDPSGVELVFHQPLES